MKEEFVARKKASRTVIVVASTLVFCFSSFALFPKISEAFSYTLNQYQSIPTTQQVSINQLGVNPPFDVTSVTGIQYNPITKRLRVYYYPQIGNCQSPNCNWSGFVAPGTNVSGSSVVFNGGSVPVWAEDTYTSSVSTPSPGTDFSFTVNVSKVIVGTPSNTYTANATLTGTLPSPAPTVDLVASPTSVTAGGNTTLSWTSTDAISCTASLFWSGSKPTSGSQSVGPINAAQSYKIACTGPGGSADDTVTVSVVPAPTVNISASPTSVASGASSNITWSSTNATSCTVTKGGAAWQTGGVAGTNISSGALTSSTVFAASCSGTGGSANNSVTVTVVGGICSNTPGYGWSDMIGWIQMFPTGGGVTKQGNGDITGYAWSDSVGWIKFGGLSGFPSGSGTVAVNARAATGGIEGWARACKGTASGDCSSMVSRTDGWDGWISLKGTGYQTTLSGNFISGGWAWGGEVVGWIQWPCAGNNACMEPDITDPATNYYVFQNYTFSAKSTDPENDTVRYGFDWNSDGTADEWTPISPPPPPVYSADDTWRAAAPRYWDTLDSVTFKVLCEDSQGSRSSWRSKTIVPKLPPPDLHLESSTCDNSGAPGDGTFTATWDTPDPDFPPTNYTVNVKKGGVSISGYPTSVAISSNTITRVVTGLSVGTDYEMTVTANYSGTSGAEGGAEDSIEPDIGQCTSIGLGCTFEPTNTPTLPVVGQPITLRATIVGGEPPYQSVHWEDSDGLNYTQTPPPAIYPSTDPVTGNPYVSITRVYSRVGKKSIDVTIFDNVGNTDGCSLSVDQGPNIKIAPKFDEY